jgi:hypothetical protein
VLVALVMEQMLLQTGLDMADTAAEEVLAFGASCRVSERNLANTLGCCLQGRVERAGAG